MNLVELFILAVGLSMDAFAVAICTGLTMKKTTVKKGNDCRSVLWYIPSCYAAYGIFCSHMVCGQDYLL